MLIHKSLRALHFINFCKCRKKPEDSFLVSHTHTVTDNDLHDLRYREEIDTSSDVIDVGDAKLSVQYYDVVTSYMALLQV